MEGAPRPSDARRASGGRGVSRPAVRCTARALAGAVLVAAAAACSDTPAPAAPEPAESLAARVGPTVDGGTAARDLAALRRATARFHRSGAAGQAGYTVLVRHPETGAACLEDPVLGGMGRHFLNADLVDDEVVADAPEVVIYEPDRNGELKLVGVEYVIPFAIRGTDESPPVLFGQEFKQNHTFDLWALHAWVWKHNPDGLFADWNPTVSCEHDGAVVD